MKDARRENLDQLLKHAEKAETARDARTKSKHAAELVRKLAALQESTHPTDAEIVRLIRAACFVQSVLGGLACDRLPDDPPSVLRVVGEALARLGPPVRGRPAAVVSPWTIHAAAEQAGEEHALDRNALEQACNREHEPGEAAERAASRLREEGSYFPTPLGAVAGTVRKPPKR